MSKIIAVNAGSSSLKFQLYEMPEETVLTSGIIERVGFEDAKFTLVVNGEKFVDILPVLNHTDAVNLSLKALVEHKVVENFDEIIAAGHRVVHGGEYFSTSVEATKDVVEKVEELCELAPLHNPSALIGYRAFQKGLPNARHIFTFDTAFHQTMAPDSYVYPVPYEWYTDYKVRRYGAHGTSHQYVSTRCAELLGKELEDTKIITLHLGGGCSITAVDGGKSINTSMGFTPLGGIMMGTRSGDIDPAIIPFMCERLKVSPKEIDTILNKKSGMLGVSGVSSDGRDIEAAIEAGNERAILTMEIFENRIVQTIGSYYLQLEGLDAIVFTAGIGENDSITRLNIMNKLQKTLGVIANEPANNVRGKETKLTTDESKVQFFLIPTNEEVMIARDTCKIVQG